MLAAVALITAAAAEAVELPGQTPGAVFSVSDSGAAEFTIPLQLPPETAGMVPDLSLAYSSNGQNGLLGIGWGLAGLSSIQRCPKTLATDGVYGRVDYSTNDQFCLDADRLIRIAGTHAQAGAEYRTERETFTKVLIQNTPGLGLWFKVWTKAGRVLEYGSTPDSRLSVA